MDLECPYCKNKLISGFIYSVREMCWIPENEKPLLGGAFGFNGESISDSRFWSCPNVKSYKCTNCNKIIVDLCEK